MDRRRPLFAVAARVALLAVVPAACGEGRTGGPRGEPAAVVAAAPDRTLAAGSARFEAAAPGAQAAGAVRFAGAGGLGGVRRSGAWSRHPELAHPAAVVDLVRGAVAVVAYGGAALRGESTFRYEAVINVERAVRTTPTARRAGMEALAGALGVPAFYADVWVDGAGRIRRVQLPLAKTTRRPHNRDRRQPELVTVDYFGFPPA